MLKLTVAIHSHEPADEVLVLTYEARQKCRQPAVTQSGREVGLFLPRGQSMQPGQVLTGADGVTVRVEAAAEKVSIVRCDDPLLFARACYHLGNRHAALQIGSGELRYLADHVLDHMVAGMGLTVSHAELPFEPEQGAYHQHDGH